MEFLVNHTDISAKKRGAGLVLNQQYTSNISALLASLLLAGIGLYTPAYAKSGEHRIISQAALNCGAIFHIMGPLAELEGGTARLIHRLGRIMDDLYITHTELLRGAALGDRDLAIAKEEAVKALAGRYDRAPHDVEGDYLWCDAWSTSLEDHFARGGAFQSEKAAILAAPSPEPRHHYTGAKDREAGVLLHSAFKAWTLKGRPTPMDEYLQLVIDEIDRECLRAWPGELLEEITGSRTLPPQVDTATGVAERRLPRKGAARKKGVFYPSHLRKILPALREVVSPGKRFLDLGSGDGRVVFLANVLGADATGIEFDAALIAGSRKALAELEGVVDRERLHLIEGDFFTLPWSNYDIIFYYDQSSFEQERVRKKLIAELPAQAVLVVNLEAEPFPGMEPVRIFPTMKILRKAAGGGDGKE